MIYCAHLLRPDGTVSPFVSKVTGSGIVDAQRRAELFLVDCQRQGALIGWKIYTVTEVRP